MAIVHIAVLSAALCVLLILQCAAFLRGKPSPSRPAPRARHLAPRNQLRIIRGPRGRGSLRRLDRGMRSWDQVRLNALRLPPIEEIAHELRRLNRQRRNPAFHSEALLAATMRSYDARLSLACRCLGINESLAPLNGHDRDAERARVEHELAAAGLVFRHDPTP
ncbi:MAG TPA: hypothetical protein VN408_36745 [Actinoplanes sp.]|nr:hypothetical protein [Actinoplanes sp.]